MMEVKRCTRCVMDNSADDKIRFNADGVCNYCTEALERKKKVYFPDNGQNKLEEILERVRKEGQGKKYDCMMGLSGGIDSSYLLYLAYKWNLRPIVVHIDDTFDTDISISNVKKLIDKTGFDMITIKPDAEQYFSLLKAYMRAGVPNLAVPQDNILQANLIKMEKKYGIKYFLIGGNFSTESILQRGNTYSYSDLTNIKAINERFGDSKLDKLDFITTLGRMKDLKSMAIRFERPLNYVDYRIDKAFKELADFCGFEYYGRKHLENKFTAFLQTYWLPKKFGVDKRTSHLSSMIISGQLTRAEALDYLNEPVCDETQMNEYIREICEKLKISAGEFEQIMSADTHKHEEYKTERETLLWRILIWGNSIKKRVSGR